MMPRMMSVQLEENETIILTLGAVDVRCRSPRLARVVIAAKLLVDQFRRSWSEAREDAPEGRYSSVHEHCPIAGFGSVNDLRVSK